MLDRLLVFNPHKRMTVTEALAHPYLQVYHDVADEPHAEPLPREFFFFDYQKEELSKEALKGPYPALNSGHDGHGVC